LATSPAAESFFPTTFPRQRLAELIREQSRSGSADHARPSNANVDFDFEIAAAPLDTRLARWSCSLNAIVCSRYLPLHRGWRVCDAAR